MVGMIKYEWKKIWGSRLTQLSIIGCSVFLIFCVYSSIIQITATDKNGQTFYGMSAVEVMKDTQQKIELTQEKVDELVNRYLGYTTDSKTNSNNEAYHYLSEDIYKTFYLPNRDLLSLITNVYREPGSGSGMKDVLEENVGKDFAKARLERDKYYIKTKEKQGQLTSEEADYWENKVENIPSYQFGYHKGWSMILDALTWPVLIMMIICIGIAPIFAGEYQSKCDSLILCMKYGKSKLISAKVIVAWLYTTCVYWGISLIYSAVYIGLLGIEGGGFTNTTKISSNVSRISIDNGRGSCLCIGVGICIYIGNNGYYDSHVYSVKKYIWGYYYRFFINNCADFLSTGCRRIYLESCTFLVTI